MKDNPYYTQLKQTALDNNYTVEQVLDATKQRVANLLSLDADAPFWSGLNEGFFTNLKESEF